LAYGSLTVLSAYRVRERVIAASEAGASCRQAAERFGVGKASAIRWHARYRAEGAIAAKPMGGDRHSHRTEAHAALILQTLEDRSQVYLREVRDALADHGAAVSLSGLSRFFRRHGISRKKGRSTRASRTART
jgi:transposase